MPGRPARSSASSAPGAISPARLVLTMSAVGFMRARSPAVTMPRAAARARLDVDMGKDAGLADQPELVESVEQRRPDRGALADQHQRLRVLEPPGERVDVLGVIVPDRHLVAGDFGVAGQGANRVLV